MRYSLKKYIIIMIVYAVALPLAYAVIYLLIENNVMQEPLIPIGIVTLYGNLVFLGYSIDHVIRLNHRDAQDTYRTLFTFAGFVVAGGFIIVSTYVLLIN